MVKNKPEDETKYRKKLTLMRKLILLIKIYERKNEYKCLSKRFSMYESKNEIREFLHRFKRESRNEFKTLGAILENVNFPIGRLKPGTS